MVGFNCIIQPLVLKKKCQIMLLIQNVHIGILYVEGFFVMEKSDFSVPGNDTSVFFVLDLNLVV